MRYILSYISHLIADPYENLAFQKTTAVSTKSSSNQSGKGPGMAVDGFLYLNPHGPVKCTQIEEMNRAFFRVDLDHLYIVERVISYVPIDRCCRKYI